MKSTKISAILVLVLGIMVLPAKFSRAEPMGTAFTYQGRLINAHKPADGLYDLQFKLYDANVGGNKVGNDVNLADVYVIDGYFTVQLDFSNDVFNSNARWLEIGVRPGEFEDPNVYTLLSPRQKITPTPYALQTRGIFVDSAGNIGIGTTEPGSYKLNVNGNIFATNYYGDGSNLTGITVCDNTISQSKLKTATGEVTHTGSNNNHFEAQICYNFNWPAMGYITKIYLAMAGETGENLTLPGGQYGFYPQVQNSGGMWVAYAQQCYITSSGQDHWLFLLVDKTTKDIISAYSAPDHPAYGNGGDFDKMPHPFGSYDETKHEIVLVDNETIAQLKQESEQRGKSILTLVNEEYKPKMDEEEVYQPLHSGKFLTSDGKQVKQMVQSIPSYIKVRKLEKLTEDDKQVRELIRQQKMQKAEQAKQKKEENKQRAINKLKALGLDEAELSALFDKQ